MFGTGRKRLEVVACLAAADNDCEASRLSMFCSICEEEILKNSISKIGSFSETDRDDYITETIQSLAAQEEFIGLGDIHPAWLVEALSRESPRIIGIILRYLPSKQVRYIIEHLPKKIKNKLPQLIDSFAVPAPILKIIKERFESQFISCAISRDVSDFRFEHVCLLKNPDLEALFKDLGIHEMAMALKGVDRRSLNILFNRLSIGEAKSLQQRIRSLIDTPPSLLTEAKYTVLEMNLAEADPEDLLIDIGLNAFARALSVEDSELLPIIRQKLEPRLGFTLKRYLDQHTGTNSSEVCEKRKELILKRIKALAKAGAIDSDIVRFFVSDSETQEFSVSESSSRETLPHLGKPNGWQPDDGVV